MNHIGIPAPELGACILAGRRAAAHELLRIVNTNGGTYSGKHPDQMLDENSSRLAVGGFEITAGIDAAIVEALAWKVPALRKRPWWRFWR